MTYGRARRPYLMLGASSAKKWPVYAYPNTVKAAPQSAPTVQMIMMTVIMVFSSSLLSGALSTIALNAYEPMIAPTLPVAAEKPFSVARMLGAKA
eukprot:CAMPEP_0181215140 /NCGR_PEP_ID=MMETSP1096-20121128/25848_1 /TAXON_ID=156174 ORGANISM="Chrysochromulina ericina, Strain CCMP281" /NCGR_SAMPLE_ID=MMETSP1096 /ASSEMBLY_ACC=CAM_ASM_000453 /LENGTH=94 /DNA_ID=CAMNT_0023306963 /DNA_START=347 /DNA_END=632 /DNA_ORIENTATION=+